MVPTSDVINEEPLGSRPNVGCEQRKRKLLKETPDLRAQMEDGSISAERNGRGFMRKSEEFPIFATLKAEVAVLHLNLVTNCHRAER